MCVAVTVWLCVSLLCVCVCLSLTHVALCCRPPLAVALCCFDRTPSRENPAAKAHGRVGALFLLVSTGLTLAFAYDWLLGAAGLVAVSCISAALLLRFQFVYQPYYKHSSNQAQMSFGLVYAWGCFCLLLLQMRRDVSVGSVCACACVCVCVHMCVHVCVCVPHCPLPGVCPQSEMEWFLFVMGAPSIAYVGGSLATWAFARYDSDNHLNSPFAVRACVRVFVILCVCGYTGVCLSE